jgi:hypothetical protein
MTNSLPKVQLPASFKVSLDPYWKSVAVYAITLIVYVVIKAMWDTTLQSGIVNVVLRDPIVVILSAFVVISTLSLIVSAITRRSIIVSDGALTFLSRFHERTFTLDDIEKIVVGGERRLRRRGVLSSIKIYINGRRRPLRIRPAVFEDDGHLVAAVLTLRRHPQTHA